LKGYGLSDKPEGLEPYRVSALLGDLSALVRWIGEPPVAVLGHDWGGTLAFCLASEHPELVSRLVVLNAAHPASYARALRGTLQLLRSWYVLLFQLRGVAEWLVTRRSVFRWLLRKLVANRALVTEARVDAVRRELLRPGAVRAALNYYRAAFRWPIRCSRVISAPTLVLWGMKDPALDIRLLRDLHEHVTSVTIDQVEDAGHFVQWDAPERVVQAVAGFLKV
jgi:pimeloyl-ACP methyl ester carboxylesterase